jgi:pimeloyl-ACP methyl ester carboxylesterase
MQQAAPATAPIRDQALTLDSTAHGGHDTFSGLLLEGIGRPKTGVILLHGRGGNPDGAVVGFLRKTLNRAGYWTLSLTNPIPKAGDEFPNYVADLGAENYVFPEAAARVRAGMAALKERGVEACVLLGFSMGGRLMAAFLAGGDQGPLPVKGLIALSIGVNGTGPLNTANTLGRVAVPMIDVCGEGDADVAGSLDKRQAAYRAGAGRTFARFVAKGTVPHNLAGAEAQVEREVLAWIVQVAPIQAYA